VPSLSAGILPLRRDGDRVGEPYGELHWDRVVSTAGNGALSCWAGGSLVSVELRNLVSDDTVTAE
jgi:hypothetical protein